MSEKVFESVENWSAALAIAEKRLVPGEILKLQKSLAFLTLGAAVEIGGKAVRISGVVLLTPVMTGRARASWNVAIGQPDTSVPPEGKATSRATGVTKARGTLASLGVYQTVWITSSLVYMPVLEYGGYPNPPKLGTWDPRRKRYVIRSSGGFSKQAPNGMVRVTLAGIRQALEAGVLKEV